MSGDHAQVSKHKGTYFSYRTSLQWIPEGATSKYFPLLLKFAADLLYLFVPPFILCIQGDYTYRQLNKHSMWLGLRNLLWLRIEWAAVLDNEIHEKQITYKECEDSRTRPSVLRLKDFLIFKNESIQFLWFVKKKKLTIRSIDLFQYIKYFLYFTIKLLNYTR